jgi:hypothetical protein
MTPDSRTSRKAVGLALVAASCVGLAILLAVTGIESSQGSCGTVLAPGWAEDAATDAACSDAYGQRRILVLLLLGAGLAVAGYAAVASRRGRHASS